MSTGQQNSVLDAQAPYPLLDSDDENPSVREDSLSPRAHKRQRREELSAPKKRSKGTKNGQASQSELDFLSQAKKFGRETRWSWFLNHDTDAYPSLIRKVYGQDFPAEMTADSALWRRAKQVFKDQVKTFKAQTIEKMRDWLEQNVLLNQVLSRLDSAGVALHLGEKFSSEDFLNVWYYMKGYLDVDKSSQLGEFYCKSMFMSLGSFVWGIVRAERIEKTGSETAKSKLHKAWYSMCLAEPFEDVDRECFKELFNISSGQRDPTPRQNDATLATMSFALIAPPPHPRDSRSGGIVPGLLDLWDSQRILGYRIHTRILLIPARIVYLL
ncbi:hypothetical protein P152DRAFT_107712 [Eremomyces bilateralis CBS 781.70]|uniref:Uncharacterized protein n=1 Tax=Eremomyces bilateralis CBS 781.70 TaxID=1392243 RepID=A0A6G1G7U9_9PEZI|nr:uncharacterized protein P152DRAFT_261244 [Eremomyces bilateralis CBS 781.70]XP_033537639.1 uncharacterized protein P152DRAFT_107712 [Eremomyces bilateralis CBS 781.70]KAF1814104.1 hypothetical protein P152DRAFT_261244 [Eremomyces bilateralis CBS 781.70]KAF1816008.1 hypothetical protein P152DRAFT_107712 [Eremomyces bilateralis CBS 781.70]